MSLYSIVFISLGAFAAVNWRLLPRLESRVRVDRSPASIPLYGTLAVLHFIRTVLLLSAIASVLILTAVAVATLSGGATVERLGAAIQRVQGLRNALSVFSPGWSALLILLSVGALVLLSRRHARMKVVGAFGAVFDEEFARVAATIQNGTAEEIPSNGAMQQVEAVMIRALTELEEVKKTGPGARQKEIEQSLGLLAQQRLAFDVQRRMHLVIDPDAVLTPPPTTFRQRLETLFVSRGLLASMRGSTRLLMYAGLLLIVPSLVSLQTATAGVYFEKRIVALEELRVEASVREAEDAWQQAQNGAPAAPAAENIDDNVALDVLSAEFENALARTPAFSGIPRTSTSLRAHSVREAIVRIRAEHSSGSVDAAPAAQAADDVTPLQRAVLDDVETAQRRPGPRTEVGRRIRADLERVRAERPAVWQRMRASARQAGHTFQQAATIDDFGHFLTNRMVGLALDDLPGNGPIAQAARELDEAMGRDAIRRMYRVKSAEYMTHLAAGRSVADAATAVSRDSAHIFWTSGESERFTAHVRERVAAPASLEGRPPTLVPRQEPHVNVRAAEDLVVSMNREGRRSGTDALATFDDWFPSHQGRELTTARARADRAILGHPIAPSAARASGIAQGVGEGLARSAAEGVARTAGGGARSFLRARSFASLRGFSRIGGVLIGNVPGEGPRLDFRGISWEATTSAVTLILQRHDGRPFRLGPYHPSVVHHALAYAADGRPVAVTMVTAAPLAELKILLHPALLDSAIGCRAIELDRFVDRFSGGLAERSGAERAVKDQEALYEHAWATRFLIGYESLSATDRTSLAGVLGRANEVLEDPDRLAAAGRAATDRAWLASPAASPIVAKPQYFDPSLLTPIRECTARVGHQLPTIDACLTDRFKAASGSYASESSRWFVPPPETIVWSGVREQNYALDPDLQFLASQKRQGSFSPLDFMLQVSFTSAPAFLPAGQDADSYDDPEPWEFPQLKSVIPRSVAAGVSQTSQDGDILDTMREFTLLQRLFRVALAERLGPRFPIERLPELAKLTAGASAPRHTPRWNAAPGRIEALLARRLMAVDGALTGPESRTTAPARAAATALHAEIDRCVATITSALNAGSPPSDDAWARACKATLQIGDSPVVQTEGTVERVRRLGQYASRFITEANEARRLRKALGVDADELKTRTQRGCPAL